MIEKDKIIPVRDKKIKEELRTPEEAKEIIEKILLAMTEIVPKQISLSQLDDIVDMLFTNPSSSLNKIWVKDNDVIAFLVFEENEKQDLYIKYFGAKNKSTPVVIILGNIRKIIEKAKKSEFKTLSMHGFNERLNNILIKRYGFKKDSSKDLALGSKTIPYLYLDLNLESSSDKELKIENKHDFNNLRDLLKQRIPDLNNEDLETILNKVVNYLDLKKISSPEKGWSTLADAIEENLRAILGNMNINTALERHQKKIKQSMKALRIELATSQTEEPELIISSDKLQLFNLVSFNQLKQESLRMKNCVGESESYIKKIIAGTHQIWSLRDDSGNPILTIEYD